MKELLEKLRPEIEAEFRKKVVYYMSFLPWIFFTLCAIFGSLVASSASHP